MKHILWISLLLFCLNSYAAINKWIDAEGKVHYSDIAPNDAKTTTIKTSTQNNSIHSPATASGVAVPKTLADREAEWKKTQKSKEEAVQKEIKEQEAALAKQKNCELARNNLASLENSPSISTYNAKGERNIMDDTTRQQNIEEARKAIANYCN